MRIMPTIQQYGYRAMLSYVRRQCLSTFCISTKLRMCMNGTDSTLNVWCIVILSFSLSHRQFRAVAVQLVRILHMVCVCVFISILYLVSVALLFQYRRFTSISRAISTKSHGDCCYVYRSLQARYIAPNERRCFVWGHNYVNIDTCDYQIVCW